MSQISTSLQTKINKYLGNLPTPKAVNLSGFTEAFSGLIILRVDSQVLNPSVLFNLLG